MSAPKIATLPAERLDSWKEIAAYLKRGARTVQRWEREAGLPVHRLQHDKLGSVYAWRSELDAWWTGRRPQLEQESTADMFPGLSIAVLPFADMSQEKDQSYFCEGIADEIINTLSKVKTLRVSSRTSSLQFRSGVASVAEIGRRLRVGAILEGSVRKSGDDVRISVQLVDVESGYQAWSARYDRRLSDIFAIQDEIAHSIVDALAVHLSPHEEQLLHTAQAADTQAYDCYLRGRKYYYQYGPIDMECAVQLFSRSIEIDPCYAPAYAGLADCWSYLYIYSDRSEVVREQALWASSKAVEMDPQSAEAQASYAFSLSIAARDVEAETAFETAIRLDPDLFEAHYFYARHSFAKGRPEEAARQYEAAMRARPDDFQAPLLVAQIYDDLGRHAQAKASRRTGVANAEQHLKLYPDDVRALYLAANGLVALGDRDLGLEWMSRALTIRPDDPMLLYNAGCIYALAGNPGEAIDCLVKAARNGLTQKNWYLHDSNLDSLRTDPRFERLLRDLS